MFVKLERLFEMYSLGGGGGGGGGVGEGGNGTRRNTGKKTSLTFTEVAKQTSAMPLCFARLDRMISPFPLVSKFKPF